MVAYFIRKVAETKCSQQFGSVVYDNITTIQLPPVIACVSSTGLRVAIEEIREEEKPLRNPIKGIYYAIKCTKV